EADTSHPTTLSIPLPSLPTAPIPAVTQTDTTSIRQYSRRARIVQSSAFLTIADEPASPMRDVSEGEACPTESSFITDQDRATIAKEGVAAKQSGYDAPIKGRSINEGKTAAKRIKKEDMRMNEQISRDAEVARIHAEEEIQGMIDSLDRVTFGKEDRVDQ
nr:hypothetical protein [Tanacetum cinerariifolium]